MTTKLNVKYQDFTDWIKRNVVLDGNSPKRYLNTRTNAQLLQIICAVVDENEDKKATK